MRYRYLVDFRRGISVFVIFSYGIAVLGTPQCPPPYYFASQSNIHSYNTRSSSRGDYYVKHSRLDKPTKSFPRYGVKTWNSLPCEMRQMSKNDFEIDVHDTLLRIL